LGCVYKKLDVRAIVGFDVFSSRHFLSLVVCLPSLSDCVCTFHWFEHEPWTELPSYTLDLSGGHPGDMSSLLNTIVINVFLASKV
jgi:hypothetical protein